MLRCNLKYQHITKPQRFLLFVCVVILVVRSLVAGIRLLRRPRSCLPVLISAADLRVAPCLFMRESRQYEKSPTAGLQKCDKHV